MPLLTLGAGAPAVVTVLSSGPTGNLAVTLDTLSGTRAGGVLVGAASTKTLDGLGLSAAGTVASSGWTVTGRAVNSISGTPISGVTISIIDSSPVYNQSTTTGSGGSAGQFTFTNVPTGTGYVLAIPGYYHVSPPFSVSADIDIEDEDFEPA